MTWCVRILLAMLHTNSTELNLKKLTYSIICHLMTKLCFKLDLNNWRNKSVTNRNQELEYCMQTRAHALFAVLRTVTASHELH